MKIDTLSTPLKVAGAAAAVLVISLFLPWYGTSVEGFGVDATATAWQAFALIDFLIFLCGVGALAALWMIASDRQRSLPLPAATLVTALGAIAAVLAIYRFLSLPLENFDRRYGLFLGLAAALGVAIAGWRAMQERGETFGEARSEIGDRVGQARSQAASTIEGDGGRSGRYEEMSREELYEEAQRRGIEGRSEMNKDELAEALRRQR